MRNFPANWTALVTPLDHKGHIDFLGLKRLLDMQVAAKVDGIVLFGSTGEGLLLDQAERDSMLDYIFNDYDLITPVWVACSHYCPSAVKQLIDEATRFDIEGVMVSAPMYIKPTQSGLISYFTEIADYSPVPLMLYNVPSRTGCDMQPETACVLSHHENIIALKDAVIDKARMKAYQSAARGFHILSGDDQHILTCMAKGGHGCVSVLGNMMPKVIQHMVHAQQDGEHDLAHLIEKRIAYVAESFASLNNPSAIKWVLAEQGYIGPTLKQPLSMITLDEQSKLARALEGFETLIHADA